MADSGIITMEEYGNVRLKLKERMDSDGINRNTLARRIGVLWNPQRKAMGVPLDPRHCRSGA